MKQIIKKLSDAIAQVIYQNGITNEMDALFDFGEWSQSEPDFSKLIKDWKLTRKQLSNYVDEAERLAKLYWDQKPNSRAMIEKPRFSYYPYNPWQDRADNLHCIFMSGQLQDTATENQKANQ